MNAWPAEALDRLRDVVTTNTPGTWSCKCPCHKQGQERRRSMRVRLGTTGVLLLRCFVCKERGSDFLAAVCRATGTMPWQWCRPPEPSRAGGSKRKVRPVANKITRTFDYVDQHGQVQFQICRFADGEPKCMPRRPWDPTKDDADMRRWEEQGIVWTWAGPRIGECEGLLYRLPDLLERPNDPVCITEGEPDADALAALGFVAVTNAFGSQHWSEAHAKWLSGRRCVVFEDNDPAGRRRTPEVVGTLVIAGAASIRVVRFPELPEHGDVSDWLSLPAMELFGPEAKFQEVCNRVMNAPEWKPQSRVAA